MRCVSQNIVHSGEVKRQINEPSFFNRGLLPLGVHGFKLGTLRFCYQNRNKKQAADGINEMISTSSMDQSFVQGALKASNSFARCLFLFKKLTNIEINVPSLKHNESVIHYVPVAGVILVKSCCCCCIESKSSARAPIPTCPATPHMCKGIRDESHPYTQWI